MRRIHKITIQNTSQKVSQDSRENGVEITFHIIIHRDANTGEILLTLYLKQNLNIFKNIASTRDT